MKMKHLNLLLGLVFILLTGSWKTTDLDCKNSAYILSQVKQKYDTNQAWSVSTLKVHIQEPRVRNPLRHTKLTLNNSTDYFEMERWRPEGMVKRILTETGESQIFLNGESEIATSVIEQYRLNADRSKGYKNFYKLMYGLPMTITDELYKQLEPAEQSTFQGKAVYRIQMALKEKMISDYWTVIIGAEDYELLALEFNHPDEPGAVEEFIKFEDKFEVDGVQIPRIRNWYIKGTNEYLGSDIIVNALD